MAEDVSSERCEAYAWVAEAYDVGVPQRVSPLGHDPWNKPFGLQTDRGMYVLRAHPFRPTDARLAYQEETLEQVKRGGVFCPQIQRTRDQALGVQRQDTFWTLHPFLAGTVYDWEAWHAAKAGTRFLLSTVGRQLALLHDLLRDASVDGDHRLDPSLPPIQFGRIKDIRRKWRDGLNRLEMNPAAPAKRSRERLLGWRQELDDEWSRLEEDVASFGVEKLPKQTVHGDVSPSKMVFRSDGLHFSLINWGFMHMGQRIYDALGDIVNRRAATQVRAQPFDTGEVRDLLLGYAAATALPLSDTELACVPVFCRARQLADLRKRLAVLPHLPAEMDDDCAALIRMRFESLQIIQRKMATRWL